MKSLTFNITSSALHPQGFKKTFNGIGDVINGLATTYLICKSNEFKLNINFDQDYYNELLNFSDINIEQKGGKPIYVDGSNLINFLKLNKDFENINLSTNGFNILEYFDLDLKSFLSKIFFSNSELNSTVRKNYSDVKSSIHFRFGDDKMVDVSFLDDYYSLPQYPYSPKKWNSIYNDNQKYTFAADTLINNIKTSDFLCSDHYQFKKSIKEQLPNLKITDEPAMHTGFSNNRRALYLSLKEMCILKMSKKITSLSSFPYGDRPSMFSCWASLLGAADYQNFSYNYSKGYIKKNMEYFCQKPKGSNYLLIK